MSPLNIDQLPAAVRAQIEAKDPTVARRRRVNRAIVGGPCAYRCVECDATFDTYPLAEKHADAEGHVRLEMILHG